MSMKPRYEINGYTGVLIRAYDDKPKDLGLFFDDKDAKRHIERKRDHHKTKGRRRVRDGRDYMYF